MSLVTGPRTNRHYPPKSYEGVTREQWYTAYRMARIIDRSEPAKPEELCSFKGAMMYALLRSSGRHTCHDPLKRGTTANRRREARIADKILDKILREEK